MRTADYLLFFNIIIVVIITISIFIILGIVEPEGLKQKLKIRKKLEWLDVVVSGCASRA